MSDALKPYRQALASLAGLEDERTRGLATAARAGREELDRALRLQRDHREAIERLRGQLAEARVRITRIESRTGSPELIETVSVPTTVDALALLVEGLIRDVESAEKAQDWIEREEHRVGVRDRPPTPASSPTITDRPALTTPARVALPARTAWAQRRRLILTVAVAAVISVITLVVYLIR